MKKSPEMLAHVILSGIAEVCAVLVFGALAYYFKHWWIALFSILYCFSYSDLFQAVLRYMTDGTRRAYHAADA